MQSVKSATRLWFCKSLINMKYFIEYWQHRALSTLPCYLFAPTPARIFSQNLEPCVLFQDNPMFIDLLIFFTIVTSIGRYSGDSHCLLMCRTLDPVIRSTILNMGMCRLAFFIYRTLVWFTQMQRLQHCLKVTRDELAMSGSGKSV